MTSSLRHRPSPSGDSPGPWHRWSSVATVLGTVIGLLSLVVALLTWLGPKDEPPTSAPVATPSATVSPTGTPQGSAAPVFLDGGTITAESGADKLHEVPRPVRGQVSHPLAIRCPSNESDDKASDVTYLLRGRYLRFDATVRPYYPEGSDQQAVTYVTAFAGLRQEDGTLRITEVGSQKRAFSGASAALRAAVEGAEKLTLRVECQNPNGTILLEDARLSAA